VSDGDVSLTDVENMLGAANTIGGAANGTMDAVSAHSQRLQSLGDFLSGDPRGQIFAAVFNPVTSTTEEAGVAAAKAQGGTAVKLGNHVVTVLDTDAKVRDQLNQYLENNPDHSDIVFMSKGKDFQTPLSGKNYEGTGAAGEDNPGLFGRQIDNPEETELGQAAMAARIADGYTGGRNYAAFRCVDSNGNVFIIAGSSAPGTHSERVLGIPALEGGFTVTDVYTERQPCDDSGSYCGTWLQNYFGEDVVTGRVAPNVTYKYPYGTTEEKKAASVGVKSDAAAVVNNPDYVAPPVTAPVYTTPAGGEAPAVVEDDG